MYVKQMLSTYSVADEDSKVATSSNDASLSILSRQETIDKTLMCGIIMLTVIARLNLDPDTNAASEKQPGQTHSPTATGDPEPAPTRCDPSAVSGQRVLRCRRLGPGEIRDAATSPCGQAADFPSGQGFWFLAAVVLPSRIPFRTKWLVWIASWEARSAKRAQAYTGGDAVRGRAAQRRAIAEFRATGASGEEEVQLAGSSPQHRTTASAGKKTPISGGPFSPTPGPPDQDGLVATYEELRCQFLNGQRAPGLMLFLRGGMRELRNIFSFSGSALSTTQNTKQPAVASEHTVLPQGMRAEVVLILAGILLHSCQESRS